MTRSNCRFRPVASDIGMSAAVYREPFRSAVRDPWCAADIGCIRPTSIVCKVASVRDCGLAAAVGVRSLRVSLEPAESEGRIEIMATKTVNRDPAKLRSRKWFANPDSPNMTALYLERYMNFGLK